LGFFKQFDLAEEKTPYGIICMELQKLERLKKIAPQLKNEPAW